MSFLQKFSMSVAIWSFLTLFFTYLHFDELTDYRYIRKTPNLLVILDDVKVNGEVVLQKETVLSGFILIDNRDGKIILKRKSIGSRSFEIKASFYPREDYLMSVAYNDLFHMNDTFDCLSFGCKEDSFKNLFKSKVF